MMKSSAVVVFNGTDISSYLTPDMLSIDYTDNEEDATDDLQIQIQDKEDTWMSKWLDDILGDTKGIPIKAVLSNGTSTLNAGGFELDSIKLSGPPGTVTIKGTSLPYESSTREQERTQAWEQYYLSGIANEIAGRGGLKCVYDSNRDPYYARVEQNKQSDISFLCELAHRAGISLKIYDDSLILFDQEMYEQKPVVRTFVRRGGGYTKWDLESGEADTKYGYCTVYYKDAINNKTYEGTAYADDYEDGDVGMHVNERVASNGEAESLAGKLLRLKNKFEFSVKLSMPGDPAMVAGVPVALTGWGLFDGKYIIKQSKHTINKSSGYTTQITLRRAMA